MVPRLTLVVLLLLAPLAAADHVFSHRVVVTGRIVDAEGLPVPSMPVTLRFTGLEAEGRCFDAREERTGPQGDFTACRHAHVVPDGVVVNVTAGEASAEAPLDPALRRVAVNLQLPGGAPARDLEGERIFAKTFRVEGRVMRLADDQRVEQVPVRAVPMAGETARVTLADQVANVTINEHGDYAIDLAIEELAADARVRVQIAGADVQRPASPLFRRADVDVVLAEEESMLPPERPGTSTPKVPLGSAAPLAALALAALIVAGARRR